jgi:hypothetical protein
MQKLVSISLCLGDISHERGNHFDAMVQGTERWFLQNETRIITVEKLKIIYFYKQSQTPLKDSISDFPLFTRGRRILARRACYIRRVCPSVRPSVCPHVSARTPVKGFSRHFILGTFIKIRREPPNLFTIGQK